MKPAASPVKRKINVKDYDILQTLGTGKFSIKTFVGSFGRVRLVKEKKTGKFFALKILKKAEILRLKQVDHVMSEITILFDIDHPFLVFLYNHTQK